MADTTQLEVRALHPLGERAHGVGQVPAEPGLDQHVGELAPSRLFGLSATESSAWAMP
jgi:hypothetical protein